MKWINIKISYGLELSSPHLMFPSFTKCGVELETLGDACKRILTMDGTKVEIKPQRLNIQEPSGETNQSGRSINLWM